MSKRKPIPLETYLRIHTSRMGRFLREGFVLEDHIRTEALGSGVILLAGTIDCDCGIAIEVTKTLSIDGDSERSLVSTTNYSYNVKLSGQGNIMRYCGPHDVDEGAHHPYHHKHVYDPFTGAKGTVEIIEAGYQPTLGEVIEEAHEWRCANSDRLSVENVVSRRSSPSPLL